MGGAERDRDDRRPIRLAVVVLLTAVACNAFVVVQPSPADAPGIAVAPRDEPTAPPPPAATPSATLTPRPTPTATPSRTPTPTATPCATSGGVVETSFPSAISGFARPARVYLPPCYGVDGRVYPTLYILHGNVRAEIEWDILGLDEAAEAGIAVGDWPPFIIVMPNGAGIGDFTSGGPWSFEGVLVNELLPYIEATYCAWPAAAGRAIGGLSRGGYWALETAFRHPTTFGSVGGHSAALLDLAAGPDVNPQHTGINNDLGDLRVYLDFGSSDHLIQNTRRLHEDLVAAGVDHEWVLNEGFHNDAYWRAHLNDYLTWYTAVWPDGREEYPPCEPPAAP